LPSLFYVPDLLLSCCTAELSRAALGRHFRFNSGEPGIGLDAAKWVIENDLALTAADTWAVEVVPNPDKSLAFVVHAGLQTKHGILNHENLIFDELIAEKKYQFVYCFTPARSRAPREATAVRSRSRDQGALARGRTSRPRRYSGLRCRSGRSASRSARQRGRWCSKSPDVKSPSKLSIRRVQLALSVFSARPSA